MNCKKTKDDEVEFVKILKKKANKQRINRCTLCEKGYFLDEDKNTCEGKIIQKHFRMFRFRLCRMRFK